MKHGAEQVRTLVDDPRYVHAERIRLVCDNLNTHRLASLDKAFEPAEAMRVAHRLELVHTPKHGSWLNMAESELSVVMRQCLGQRIDQLDVVDELARQTSTRVIACTTPAILALYSIVFRGNALFHRHRLGQIPRLVHIRPPCQRRMVSEQLQRHHVQDRRQQAIVFRQADHVHPFA